MYLRENKHKNNKTMKKLISIILVMMISLGSYAQDVTKFLGIPVDGTKESMKQKLIQKGFKYWHESLFNSLK